MTNDPYLRGTKPPVRKCDCAHCLQTAQWGREAVEKTRKRNLTTRALRATVWGSRDQQG